MRHHCAIREPVELVGRATDFWFSRNWSSHYWREDFTFLLSQEGTQKTWRIISREPTPAYTFRMGTTFTDLKVDWKKQPRVKVVGVKAVDRIPADFYDFKLTEPNLATALIVYVETAPKVWKEYYVNNWFHKWGDRATSSCTVSTPAKRNPMIFMVSFAVRRLPSIRNRRASLTNIRRIPR